MADTATIQVGNWRAPEVQILDEDGDPIDMTGATGSFIWNSPGGSDAYAEDLQVGRQPRNSIDATEEGEQGWVHATFQGIDVAGQWSEQVQAILPGDSEPLNAGVETFDVLDNLAVPTP